MIGAPRTRARARERAFLLCDSSCFYVNRRYLSDHTDGWSAIFSAGILTEIRLLSLRYRASHATSFSLFFLPSSSPLVLFFINVHISLDGQLKANIFRAFNVELPRSLAHRPCFHPPGWNLLIFTSRQLFIRTIASQFVKSHLHTHGLFDVTKLMKIIRTAISK